MVVFGDRLDHDIHDMAENGFIGYFAIITSSRHIWAAETTRIACFNMLRTLR